MLRDSHGLVWHRGTVWRTPVLPRLVQVVNFLFGIVYVLLIARFFLEYARARPSRSSRSSIA